MPSESLTSPFQGIVIELGFTETSFVQVVATVKQLAGEVESLRAQIEDGGTVVTPPAPGAPTITGTPPTSGQVGEAFTFTPTTAGGTTPRVLSVQSGTLPTGVTLSPSTGLSGTLSAAGSFGPIVLRVTDAAGQHADLAAFSVVISTGSSGGPDTRPGWFAAPVDAATTGTAAFIAGRTRLSSSVNGGKAGGATVTTGQGTYAWFAVANVTAPVFRDDDSGLAGGFSAQGSFTDSNGTAWRLYRSTYPGTYASKGVTLI